LATQRQLQLWEDIEFRKTHIGTIQEGWGSTSTCNGWKNSVWICDTPRSRQLPFFSNSSGKTQWMDNFGVLYSIAISTQIIRASSSKMIAIISSDVLSVDVLYLPERSLYLTPSWPKQNLCYQHEIFQRSSFGSLNTSHKDSQFFFGVRPNKASNLMNNIWHNILIRGEAILSPISNGSTQKTNKSYSFFYFT
jgi:hypothetical protein